MSIIEHSKKSAMAAGFTLLEILVAMLLVTILTGALFGTYFTLAKSRERVFSGMESLRDVRSTLDLLRREISSAFYIKDNTRLHFVVEDRDCFGKQCSNLDFTTVTTPLAGSVSSSDVAAVHYAAGETKGRLFLARNERDVFIDAKPTPYPLIEDVQGFLVECYDGSRWVTNWDTSLNDGLPKAVRITITVKDRTKASDFSLIAVPRVRET